MRDANERLTARLDVLQRDRTPDLHGVLAVRDELDVAYEMLNEMREKYDQAIANLVLDFGSNQPEVRGSDRVRDSADAPILQSNSQLPSSRRQSVSAVFCHSDDESDDIWGHVRDNPGQAANDASSEPNDSSSLWQGKSQSYWQESTGNSHNHAAACERNTESRDELCESLGARTSGPGQEKNSIWANTSEWTDEARRDTGIRGRDIAALPEADDEVYLDATSADDESALAKMPNADACGDGTFEMSDEQRGLMWAGGLDVRRNDNTNRLPERESTAGSWSTPVSVKKVHADPEFGWGDAERESDAARSGDEFDSVSTNPGIESDDGVQEYIAQLLNQTPSSEENPNEVEPEEEVDVQQAANSDIPMVPRSVAPELDGMTAMREYANVSARSAIAHSAKTQKRVWNQRARLQFVCAGATIICGGTLYFNVSALPRFLAVTLCAVIALAFIKDGVLAVREARRRWKVAQVYKGYTDNGSEDSCLHGCRGRS